MKKIVKRRKKTRKRRTKKNFTERSTADLTAELIFATDDSFHAYRRVRSIRSSKLEKEL